MKPRTLEFTAPEFSAFALVGEETKDGAQLLADKLARQAAADDLARRQTGLDFGLSSAISE